MSSNPYQVGVGGFVVVSLYVVILAFMWRALASRLAGSNHPTIAATGAAMGTTL